MRHCILGTAGHVDHGKTALIGKLTGTQTDRLKEEQERGISIELGFAELSLSDSLTLGVVDVPGHEKFVKQMVAGAGGVDLAMLIIAADEGVMPQTIEHLEILSSLGVSGGAVVITKSDLVDPEMAELAAEEAMELVEGTFLEDRPIITVSAITGDGIDELKKVLISEVEALPDRSTDGGFRLPVDRVFTMPGAGVIVTGTCWSGSVKIGDSLVLEPDAIKVRVRDVQAHGSKVDSGYAGQRLAIALNGVKKDELGRGYQLASPVFCQLSRRLDARLNLVPHFDGYLKNRQRVHIHHAGREVLARVVLLDKEELANGIGEKTALVQLHLESPLITRPGDKLIVRFYSPLVTMAGGEILANNPQRRKRFDEEALAELAILEKGDSSELVLQELEKAGTLGLPKAEAAGVEGVLIAGETAYLKSLTDKIAEQVSEFVTAYSAKYSLRAGMPREEMRRRVKFKGKTNQWNKLCEVIGDDWEVVGDKIGPVGGVQLSAADKARVVKYEAELLQSGMTAAKLDDEELLNYLINKNKVIKIADGHFVHTDSLAKLVADLQAYFTNNDGMDFSSFRELSGLSRKLGIPTLEYLDSVGYTRREGDVRIAGAKLESE